MDTLDSTCSTLNLQTASVTWEDATTTFPVYSVSTADVKVTTTSDISGVLTNTVSNPSSTMERICEFFGNVGENSTTYKNTGEAFEL